MNDVYAHEVGSMVFGKQLLIITLDFLECAKLSGIVLRRKVLTTIIENET